MKNPDDGLPTAADVRGILAAVPMTNPTHDKPSDRVESVVEELSALHVWPQSVADHHADVLTPRQIKMLYEVGNVATRAEAVIRDQQAEIERLRETHTDKAAAWDAAVAIPRKVQAELDAFRTRAEQADARLAAMQPEAYSPTTTALLREAIRRLTRPGGKGEPSPYGYCLHCGQHESYRHAQVVAVLTAIAEHEEK